MSFAIRGIEYNCPMQFLGPVENGIQASCLTDDSFSESHRSGLNKWGLSKYRRSLCTAQIGVLTVVYS
jgi:hypothetical protein